MTSRSLSAALPLLAGLLVLGGCDPQRNLYLLGIPGVDFPFVVTGLQERWGYLDVTARSDGTTLRAYVPATPECAAVLAPETRVAFEVGSPVGTFEGPEGQECEAVGLGSLADWRERRPEPTGLGTTPLPREPAFYERVYMDEDVAFLRGTFPLSNLIGWTDLNDTIAVVPVHDPQCARALEGDTASMVYRPVGEPVFSLMGESGPCPILAFVKPPRTAPPPPEALPGALPR